MSAWTQSRPDAPAAPRVPSDAACAGMGPLEFANAHADALMHTVETEIIPRLMLLHRAPPTPTPPALRGDLDAGWIGADEVEAFVDRVLEGHDAAMGGLRECAERGVPVAALCLHLLAPAARRLGDLWNADLCDFTQVTIALGRLQALLRGIASGLPSFAEAAPQGRLALFAPAPGEQHTLGLAMVRDFFRASGWDVCDEAPGHPDGLLSLMSSRHFDLIGFSIGSERHVDALADLVAAVRKASANRLLRVLAGGPLLLAQPDLARRLGVDATATDARQAILAADGLLFGQGGGR
jgi:MerR family transcriptional regulator, light-induced transcriptional regulator